MTIDEFADGIEPTMEELGLGRRCVHCGKFKYIVQLSRCKTSKLGVAPRCLDCYNKAKRNTPEKMEARRLATERHRAKHPERARRIQKHRSLKINYGITIDEFEEMVSRCGSRCEICGKEVSGRQLHVDHCHETGRVRGILCYMCNSGLGSFGDSVANLEAAILYLRRTNVIQ